MKISEYQSKVGYSHEQSGYLKVNVNPDAFGASVARAMEKLGETSQWFSQTMMNIHNDIREMQGRELANYIDSLERTDLQDPEHGYYSKLGKDAMTNPDDPNSGASGVMNSLTEKINQKQKELGLTWGQGQRIAESVKASKLNMIYKGVAAHELKQTQSWALSTLEESQNDAINKGITHRDNEEDIALALGNGRSAIISQARVLHWDNDTTRIQLAKFASQFHSGVLNAYLQDGSLKASEYYEAHKGELMPDAQARYLGAVKDNELRYTARSVSERLYSLYADNPAGAYAEIDKIQNEKERNAIESRMDALFSKKERIERQVQDKLMDDMWNKVSTKLQNGEVPSEDDIPIGLDGKNWYNAKRAIDQIATKGDIDTNNEAYTELYEMSVTDAQRFANINLTQYRAELSNADYKAFQKRQIDIKNMTPTQLSDEDTVIKNGLKSLGYSYNKKGELETAPMGDHTEKKSKAFINSANAYVRELELKKGKHLTAGEMKDALQEFSHDYAYKDKKGKASDLYIEGMNKQVGFMRNVINDFQAAAKAKGSALTDEEKYKIVAERVSKTAQEDNKDLSQNVLPRQAQKGDTWHGHTITSIYGPRKAPKPGASTNHKGVDLSYKNNEPFEAFVAGKVVKKAFDKNGYGNYVDIQDANGTIHRYGHANSISVNVGQKVEAGQRLGRAGATGTATGPHLHYETIVNGVSVNPIKSNNDNRIANNGKGWAF